MSCSSRYSATFPKMLRKGFPPLEKQCPKCANKMSLSERYEKRVKSCWKEVSLPRERYRCPNCATSVTCWVDGDLDESNCLPETLARMSEVGKLLAFQQGAKLLARFGIEVSKSQLQGLAQGLNEQLCLQGCREFAELAEQPLVKRLGRAKTWVIEVDGKFVPTRGEQGLDWREVKTAVLYPVKSPSERYYLSLLAEVDGFAPLVHGLLRHAGVAQEDRLIGVSDGALWIAALMGDLGVHRHILDVYHASSYLDPLMQALGWTEEERETERRALLRGDIDVQRWLNAHLPTHFDATELDATAQKALAYLTKQALLDHTCYPRFKQEGIEVIASGQIEGANKAVIGHRLNLSGAHWSEAGATFMAFARADYHAERPIISFESVRHAAFPQAA